MHFNLGIKITIKKNKKMNKVSFKNQKVNFII